MEKNKSALLALLRTAAGAAALLLASPGMAQAQSAGDDNVDRAAAQKQATEIAHGGPARWHQEDTTGAARLRTLRKEMGAALREAQNACRKAPAAERADCHREARATYRQDMASVPDLAAAGPAVQR